MQSMSLSQARAEFDDLLDQAGKENAAPVEIKRRGKPSAVLMSSHQYDCLLETLVVTKQFSRFYESKADIEAGRYWLQTIPGVNGG